MQWFSSLTIVFRLGLYSTTFRKVYLKELYLNDAYIMIYDKYRSYLLESKL